MTEAIFGLIGVLIGGLLNGGVTYLTERRRQAGDAKVAARLVADELEVNEVALGSCEKQKSLSIMSRASVSEWRKHRGTLAAALTDDEWRSLRSVFNMYEQLILMGQVSGSVLTTHIEESIRLGITRNTATAHEGLQRIGATDRTRPIRTQGGGMDSLASL